MNLVAFSIQTKGIHNFTRRLWTVFTRFGFSEEQTRNALYSIVNTLQNYHAAPTFFIPAAVLRRHPSLIAEMAHCGVEIGIHGYVHNDYRLLCKSAQYEQTQQAISVFQDTHIPYQGFRNPYLGWTEETLSVFAELNFTYESNEAVLHDVIDLDHLSPLLRCGYEKSLALFQAIPCNAYTLRPHFEGTLLRIPTSIPDDEILFDRLRITKPEEVGAIWSSIMQCVYDLGGLYTLNLHPERGVLCKQALNKLLSYSYNHLRFVWIARLVDVARWWKERSQFRLCITPQAPDSWLVEAKCSPWATVLARHVAVEDAHIYPWSSVDVGVDAHRFFVRTTLCPCIALSLRTPPVVAEFLMGQGYPVKLCSQEESNKYSMYFDIVDELGTTRQEQIQWRGELIHKIEQAETPLIRFACWPDGNHAALAVSGDIDSVTIQDFFLRIREVNQYV